MTDNHLLWLRQQFDRCQHWIQAALDRDVGTHTINDVWAAIDRGDAQLWPLPNGVMVTDIEIYPQKKALRGWLAGGDLQEIVASEPNIANWAKKQGCDLILIAGRPGWARSFDGYERAYSVMMKRL